ncbi:MAG: exodeoxyribonuclease VII large subunit [Alphaproteobacteria bacterium]|nr:exodeoxyribonuclease VII large subunit [Alphaproteobacteria bacterium]
MPDTAPTPPIDNIPTFAVSELALAVRRRLEADFERVRVRGEISGCKFHSSGHVYLSLKDEGGVLAAICWRGVAGKLKQWLQDGFEVVATGQLTTYPGRSQYQLVIESLEPAGIGALLKMIEERKQRLAAEGLFASTRKQALPFLPRVIGVVTSPTGAVIRDILHRLNDRFPLHVLLWPVAVQGDGAASQIAAAINGFNALPAGDGALAGGIPRPDLLIVARGGGSVEDLMAFNEEVVVRAAAASAIPLISAVGHETDNTLIDLAADVRAPTPTAAAEMAVPVRAQLALTVNDLGQRLARAAMQGVTTRQDRLQRLTPPHPARLLLFAQQRLDDVGARLSPAVTRPYELGRQSFDSLPNRLIQAANQQQSRAEQRLRPLISRLQPALMHGWQRAVTQWELASRLLQQLSYRKTLERGFVMVQAAGDGSVISRADQLPAATPVAARVMFADGQVAALLNPPDTGDGATTAPARLSPGHQARRPKTSVAAKPSTPTTPDLFGD